MRDAETSQLVASIGLYKSLEEGGGPEDVENGALYLQVKGGETWFERSSGPLEVTFVSDTEIVGSFDVDLLCCGSGFSGRPPLRARARGRFNATYAGPYVR